MNIFLILMVSISMTGYQYYNKIKSYISGREEFSSVEENQLKFSLGCLKEMHLKNVNFHNSSRTRLPINTPIANDKTCGINQDKMFSVKLCVSAGSNAPLGTGKDKGGNGNGGGAASSIGSEQCFNDDNNVQYVVSVLDTDINTSQYALILNEDVSFTSESGNLKGPSGSKKIPLSVLNSLPQNVKIPNNRAILIHAATTAETKLAIEKTLTSGKLSEYAGEENLKCENYEDYNSSGSLHKNQCLSKRGWIYSPQSCTWICPQLTFDEIKEWKEFRECQKNGGLLVIKELTSVGKKFACVADYRELFSKNICNGKNGFIEIVEQGEGKNKKFLAACMERKKSESGCSVCQIPVPDLSTGKWVCSLPRKESAIKNGSVNMVESVAYDAISVNFSKNSNSDVKYIKEAGCLKGCEGYLTGTVQGSVNGKRFYQIKWDPSQRLFKCTGCPAGQYEQESNGAIKCVTPKCTGNLVYVEEIDRCVAMQWCKFKSSAEEMAKRGIFRGNLDGNCGLMSKGVYDIKSDSGLDKADVKIKVSTLFRKTYNPKNKCFYCRIVLPEPITGNPSGNKKESIIEKLLFGIKELANIKLISDLYANESEKPTQPEHGISDTIDEASYKIDANNYPPYVGSSDVKNIGQYLQIQYEKAKSFTKETDLMYCGEDINSYKKTHIYTKSGASSTNSKACMNCRTGDSVKDDNNDLGDKSGGICMYSKGRTVSGYTSTSEKGETTGKQLHLVMRSIDASKNDGYASGLGGKISDWKKYISMWENSGQCVMVCNSKDVGCNVVQGYKRIYRNTEFTDCADNRYNLGSGYPGSAEGGWSGAIRDFDLDQKPYGINTGNISTLKYSESGNASEITGEVQIPKAVYKEGSTLNYCSLYIDGSEEVKGTTTLTKYLYDKVTGKTLCWPRLSVITPDSVGKGMYEPNTDSQLFGGGSGENIERCEKDNIFGVQTCIGQVLRSNSGEGLDLVGILTNSGGQAKYTTKLADISYRNKIECDYKAGFCRIQKGVPPSVCNRNSNTLYHDIITLLAKNGIIHQNAINGYLNNLKGSCEEGYRKSITWNYKNVTFKPKGSNQLSSKVITSNCFFCEKILFTEATVDKTEKVKDWGDPDGIANYYLGKWKWERVVNNGNNTNEYKMRLAPLVTGDPLQKGMATIPVFRVDPNMTLSDYEKTLSEDFGKYVDPFDAFITYNSSSTDDIGAILKIRTKEKPKPNNSNVTLVHLLKSDSLAQAKRGNNDILNRSMVRKDDIINFYGCFNEKGVCKRKKSGICPSGMIATVNNKNNIECHTYVSNSHRSGCYTKYDGKIIDQVNSNTVASGSNTVGNGNNNRASAVTGAHGRMGCLNGYKITNGSNGLMCDKYINHSGSSIKHCRNKGIAKYKLIPVFSNGKLSFECKHESGKNTCRDVVTDGSNILVANKCATGSIEIVPLGKTVDQNGNDTYKTVAKNNDQTKSTCSYYRIETDPSVDDFGRKFIINRASSMFIANDCFVCL